MDEIFQYFWAADHHWQWALLGFFLGGFLALIPWKRAACFFGFHNWIDIHEDRVQMLNHSPTHYTVYTHDRCIRPECRARREVE